MKFSAINSAISVHRTAIFAMALAFSACAIPLAAQNRPGEPGGYVTIQESPAQPLGGDVTPPEDAQDASVPAATRPSSGPVPSDLTLSTGTLIPVRVNQWLSSDRNHPGDTFSGVLEQPLISQGWVVVRRGQSVIGRVSVAQKAGHGKDVSQLGLELTELSLVDGQQLPVRTQLVQSEGRPTSSGREAATIGTTTVIGAAIGAAAGGGTGLAIGAGAGAVAGAAGVAVTHGKPTIIAPETVLTFRLEEPLAISTDRSQLAFRPVNQSDYDRPDRDQDAYARPEARGGAGPVYGPTPYPYYFDYAYGGYPWGWGYYPPVYLGFYGGGFGSRFGFGRGVVRGGFRR
jgi:hypothetical protein